MIMERKKKVEKKDRIRCETNSIKIRVIVTDSSVCLEVGGDMIGS